MRIFVESVVNGLDSRDALEAAYPEFVQEGTPLRKIQAKISWLYRHEGVRAFLEAVQGHAAFTSGLSYADALRMLWYEGTDEKNPPSVRVRAISTYAEHLRVNGVAEIEGFVGEHSSGAGAESGAIPATAANEFIAALTGKTAIPAAEGSGSG